MMASYHTLMVMNFGEFQVPKNGYHSHHPLGHPARPVKQSFVSEVPQKWREPKLGCFVGWKTGDILEREIASCFFGKAFTGLTQRTLAEMN
jgi:hypothetical protein